MTKYSLKQKKFIILYLLFYSSLIFGFFLNEDFSGGARNDFFFIIESIENNFQNGIIYFILELNKLTTLQHTPAYYIILYFLKNNLENLELIRFLLLHIFLIFPIVFYYLAREFGIKKEISKYIPLIFFISPYFRSSYIWSASILLALIFFSLSLLFFKKFKKKETLLHLYISLIFLIIASYIRPELGIIISYYFIKIIEKLNLENVIKILFFCFICSLPFFYYYFFIINFSLDKFEIPRNIVNNFIFFLSVFFFYLLPFFIFDKKKLYIFIKFLKKKLLFYILINIIFLFFLENISLPEIGGGIFVKLLIIGKIENLFFIFPSLGVFVFIFLVENLKYKEISKEFFILTIFLIQTSINIHFFQKYLDLLFIFYFLFIFSKKLFYKSFNEKNFIIKFLSFHLIFYISNFLYYY